MEEAKLDNLKKQYPEQHYNVSQDKERLIVSKKKRAIRLYRNHLERLKQLQDEGESVSDTLNRLLHTPIVSPKDFEQIQVSVDLKVIEALTEKSMKCKTRKLMYLEKLLRE